MLFRSIYPEDVPLLGATDHLRDAIATGAWSGLPDGGTKWVRAAKRFGVEAVSNPKIRIGTVHSVKGQEASKVVLLTSVGKRIRQILRGLQLLRDLLRQAQPVAKEAGQGTLMEEVLVGQGRIRRKV